MLFREQTCVTVNRPSLPNSNKSNTTWLVVCS